MSFISIEFVILFAIFIPIYFNLKQQHFQILLILVTSYVFYSFSRLEYIFLLLLTTTIDYFAAIGISRIPQEKSAKRRNLLALSLAANLGLLFLFKYYNFFSDSIQMVLTRLGIAYQPVLHDLILPVGISFYTFQSIAYTVDVYRNRVEAETNFLRFASYVAFFPQLVAGPIERASRFLVQFHSTHRFDYVLAVSGFRLILWGMFKKVVIADRLAIYVNTVFNNIDEYQGLILILATFFFTFQIYCDFSGYSDIAIGVARVMGFDLMENFRQPYFATSVREFWSRWHISLSTWFRDYLYIPLGGNRVSFAHHLINLMIVFLVSGLWHGANWTFVLWGLLHGVYVVVEASLERFSKSRSNRSALQSVLQALFCFSLISFAWIFFRANSIEDAFYVTGNLLNFSQAFENVTQPFGGAFLSSRIEFLLAFILISFLLIVDWYLLTKQKIFFAIIPWRPLRWLAYYILTICIIVTYILYSSTAPAFIYFQF